MPRHRFTKVTKATKITKIYRSYLFVTLVIFVIFVMKPWAVSAQMSRTMALTFDDLPKSEGAADLEGARRTTESILRVLKAHHAPAVAFVNEQKLYKGIHLVPERVALLRAWVDAGVTLGNHTYSHIDINNVPLRRYENNVIRGEKTYTRLMRGHSTVKWFRHPYLHTGPTKETKAALNKFLAIRGYRVAPVTAIVGDWVFSPVYAKAKAAHDEAIVSRVRDAYLDYADTMLAWFETLAKEDFGREIPQVLLIHSNDLHTDVLDALLTRLERRGYRFVTLGDAMKDPVYRTPDDYAGPDGPSWLHRWRVTKHLPDRTRKEPALPQWIVDLSK
ncbi:MAG TPA: polysaccharide deacetylase family protein [Vicinamibacterales bacterium]|nr:polysaccharide deacetylase family protein [Vicinamibacterales bacterium]